MGQVLGIGVTELTPDKLNNWLMAQVRVVNAIVTVVTIVLGSNDLLFWLGLGLGSRVALGLLLFLWSGLGLGLGLALTLALTLHEWMKFKRGL